MDLKELKRQLDKGKALHKEAAADLNRWESHVEKAREALETAEQKLAEADKIWDVSYSEYVRVRDIAYDAGVLAAYDAGNL